MKFWWDKLPDCIETILISVFRSALKQQVFPPASRLYVKWPVFQQFQSIMLWPDRIFKSRYSRFYSKNGVLSILYQFYPTFVHWNLWKNKGKFFICCQTSVVRHIVIILSSSMSRNALCTVWSALPLWPLLLTRWRLACLPRTVVKPSSSSADVVINISDWSPSWLSEGSGSNVKMLLSKRLYLGNVPELYPRPPLVLTPRPKLVIMYS